MSEYIDIIEALESYCIPLQVQYEHQSYMVGICLSQLDLNNLNKIKTHFLHPKEKNYFATFQHPKRQHSYLLGRYCAKKVLASIFKINDITEIFIENGVFQQPITVFPPYLQLMHPNLQVSISHTDSMGAALVFPEAHPMGIDIETIDENKNEIICTQLTKKELHLISSSNNVFFIDSLPISSSRFQMLWSIKEALSKVIKCGLTVPFEVLEIESIIVKEYVQDYYYKNYYISHFKNFTQYQALSFFILNNVCSIVYPKKSDIKLNDLAKLFSK